MKIPQLIGHRGAAAYAPENTLASIHKARALGAQWVEVDAKLTADGQLILMHDDTVNRTTNGTGPAAGMTLADMQALDAGSWFSAAYAGERVPTLRTTLDVVRQLGMGINIEIKPCPGRELETGKAVALEVAAHNLALERRVLLSSFAPEALAAAKDLAPHLPRGLLVEKPSLGDEALFEKLGCSTYATDHKHITPDLMSYWQRQNVPVLVYTVNSPERARTLFDQGVAAVFTDKPDMMR